MMSKCAESSDPILILKTCTIRPYREDDAEDIAREADNPRIAIWMSNTFPHPYRNEDALRWINLATSASPPLNFAICHFDGDKPIGSIGLKTHDDIHYRTMEIGFWVGEKHWGKGIMREAVQAFSMWTFETFKHVVRLEAEVFEGNDASARVLEKAGYTFETRKILSAEKAGTLMNLLIFRKLRPES